MHLDLVDLRLFVCMVEAGSITGGAGRAGLALASASARLKLMEAKVGGELVVRGRRGIEPTRAGLALLHHARLVLEQMGRLRADLGAFADGIKGQVRLLANSAAASEALPELLAGFLAAEPAIDVAFDERTSLDLTEAIAGGMAEIGIAADHADFTGLETFPFGRDRLVLIVPRDHAFAERQAIRFKEALEAGFIGLAGESALHRHLMAHARRAGRTMRLRARAPGVDLVCRMVAAGAGAAIVPEGALQRVPEPGRLAVLRLDETWAERRLLLVTRSLAALPPPARLLAGHLLAAGGGGPAP